MEVFEKPDSSLSKSFCEGKNEALEEFKAVSLSFP